MPRKREITRRTVVAGLTAAGALASGRAMAQSDPAQGYPSKAVRIIVGFGPGGGNDIFARLIGAKLQERLGQAFVVENKPGAGAMIATEFVAKSPPDGYTLLVGATGAMTISPALYSKMPYDTLRDFAPVSMVASFPLLVVVNAAAPVKTLPELIAYCKANPAKSNYASSSPAFQLATELFKQKTGMPAEHISYKSSGESLAAVVSGEVLFSIADAPPVSGHLKAGRIRGLAVTDAKRLAEFPDVPTGAEAGVPGVEVRLWSGLFAPAATPAGIVKKLQDHVIEIVRLPDVAERLKSLAVDPAGNTSEEFRQIIARDLPQWKAVATAANIKLD